MTMIYCHTDWIRIISDCTFGGESGRPIVDSKNRLVGMMVAIRKSRRFTLIIPVSVIDMAIDVLKR